MIQTLWDMIRRFCVYFMELKDSYGFTHDWCTLIPAFKLAYKASIHPSTVKTHAILEKGWSPRLPVVTFEKDLVGINPNASSFKVFIDKVRHHSNQSVTDAFE
ncbi:hypothetical protein O181_015394 [Austropuccinia psidii MF-1]|uniref:Uncharacterized protein n=1 Tax=Austropuccinia psidii MF-1 TaxID=1389203 RepID=A0A9Q3BZW3_9BASI|nr:hypothetical protein [Austropuccinia psidii MF-1]